MNNNDLKRNYYALLICICKQKTAKEALMLMRITPDGE